MAQYIEAPHRAFLTGGVAFGKYVRVKLSGSTANTIAIAGAGEPDIGVLTRQCFTTDSVADVMLTNADGTIPMVASGAITANSLVYPAAAGKVSATVNGVPLGRALTATTADLDVLEVLRFIVPPGKLFTSVAASTAITNTTTETAFDQNYVIPANTLAAGDRIRVRFQGIATATNSTDTLAIKLIIASALGPPPTIVATIVTLAARDVANNDIFYGDFEIVFRTVGASGTLTASGIAPANPNAAGTAANINFLASTTIDTTAAQTIAVDATWSVANAGNSCRLDMLDIERLPG